MPMTSPSFILINFMAQGKLWIISAIEHIFVEHFLHQRDLIHNNGLEWSEIKSKEVSKP